MGLGTQMTAWDEAFCAQLASHGFFVVRFDNRDCGKSTRLEAAEVPNIMLLMGQMALGRQLNVPTRSATWPLTRSG